MLQFSPTSKHVYLLKWKPQIDCRYEWAFLSVCANVLMDWRLVHSVATLLLALRLLGYQGQGIEAGIENGWMNG